MAAGEGNGDGAAPRPPRRVRLADVAAAAGISKGAASRALAGYGNVSEETRRRVLDVAQRLGYRASTRARALALGRGGAGAAARCAVVALGMSRDELAHNLYHGAVLCGVVANAAVEHVDIHVTAPVGDGAPVEDGREGMDGRDGGNGGSRRSPAEQLAEIVAEDRADGFIVVTYLDLQPEDVAPLARAGLPYVLVNRWFADADEPHHPGPPVHHVTADFAGGVAAAVERLVALGHRRLALLLPERSVSPVAPRAAGWRTGVARCGLDETQAPIVRYAPASQAVGAADDQSGARVVALDLLRSGLPGGAGVPTGIVCYNDHCAIQVLRAAATLGIPVPERLSVIGFDDLWAPVALPPLCSFGPHPAELGAAAIGLLGRLLCGDGAAPERVVLECRPRWRGSCGKARTQD
jgi:LacI family transcriptional regulator